MNTRTAKAMVLAERQALVDGDALWLGDAGPLFSSLREASGASTKKVEP